MKTERRAVPLRQLSVLSVMAPSGRLMSVSFLAFVIRLLNRAILCCIRRLIMFWMINWNSARIKAENRAKLRVWHTDLWPDLTRPELLTRRPCPNSAEMYLMRWVTTRNCNPELVFPIPEFGIEDFVIPASRRHSEIQPRTQDWPL